MRVFLSIIEGDALFAESLIRHALILVTFLLAASSSQLMVLFPNSPQEMTSLYLVIDATFIFFLVEKVIEKKLFAYLCAPIQRQTTHDKITRKNALKCALFANLFSLEFLPVLTRFFLEKNDKSHVITEKTKKKRHKIYTKITILLFTFFSFIQYLLCIRTWLNRHSFIFLV